MLKKVDFLAGGTTYIISSILVYSALAVGCKLLPPPVVELNPSQSVSQTFFYWDGNHYRNIAKNGYSYSPNRPSEVAFFPLYPYAARALTACTCLGISSALILLSNIFLAGCFVLLHAYTRTRFPDQPRMPAVCLIVFAVYAPTLFFHLPYSEPLFSFLVLLALLAFHRNSSMVILAVIVGAATAARPVGICLFPLIFFASSRYGGTRLRVLGRAILYTPLAAWGLLCFILLQWLLFSEPLAFIHTQHYWRTQFPVGWADKISSLLVLEPFWGAFDSSSHFYWKQFDKSLSPILSLVVFNRLAFAAAFSLLYIGFHSKILNTPEFMVSLFFILLPYITKGYDNSMISMARFTAVIFPLYGVASRLLLHLPHFLAIIVILLLLMQLLAFSALFGAGYQIY